ncbi:MAG: protein phosphatase 2C domain-containing protein, partial [Oligoflexia bacterium]|nr:protein phosphatase 2C domain-containing protein [Oligoflexia bacterium]
MVHIPLTYRAAAATLRGKGHIQNEDAWSMVRTPDGGALYAVADGVSTSPRGRWAARHTTNRLSGLLRDGGDIGVKDLVQLVGEVDWELREEGRGSAACTLSVAWLRGDRICLLHVGDSAIYRVRDGRITQLSHDMGRGAQLNSFMGMGPVVSERIQVGSDSLHSKDGLLLITDGVTSVMRHTELAGWWLRTGRDPELCVRGVIAEAGRREAHDD